MVKVIWTEHALSQLRAIRDYIELESPEYAVHVAKQILTAIDRLAMFPRSGRVPFQNEHPDVREAIWSSYRIFYRIGEGHVRIIGVRHAARNTTVRDLGE